MKSLWVFCFALFVIPSDRVNSDDWPRWMGPSMNGVWAETGILDEFAESGADVLWRASVGGGYGGPAVAGDRVYIMDRVDEARGGSVENNIGAAGNIAGEERVQCLSVATGEVLWSHSYECPYTVAYPTGPRCTPAVDGQYVYTLGAMGDLICFHAGKGTVVWKKNLTTEFHAQPPMWGFSSHPLIDGDRLFVPAGGEGSGVVALDKITGDEIWRAVTTIDVAYAPLVLYDPDHSAAQLIFWHGEGIVALNPEDGAEYWTVKFPEEPNPSITSIATPRIVGDRLLISEFYKGSLLLQLESDPPGVRELWRSFETDPGHKNGLNSMMTTPVVKDGYAYGIAYIGRGSGVFRCLEIETGELVWSKDDWMEEDPVVFATAFIVENHGRYFLFNDNGELMIANLTPEGFEEIDRAKILEPTSVARGRDVVWSHPAFADRKMFARNDKEIVCVDLSERE